MNGYNYISLRLSDFWAPLGPFYEYAMNGPIVFGVWDRGPAFGCWPLVVDCIANHWIGVILRIGLKHVHDLILWSSNNHLDRVRTVCMVNLRSKP